MKKEIEILFEDETMLTTKKILENGISKSTLGRLIKMGELQRVARGLYTLPNELHDLMYILHQKYKKGVFSHESALYIHGMTDRNPETHVMTVYRNYNVKKSEKYPVNFKYVSSDVLDLGVEWMETDFGNKIPVYNIERTICDIIRSDTKMDSYVVNYALREFASKAKFSKMMLYAEKLGIANKVRKKLEVLL